MKKRIGLVIQGPLTSIGRTGDKLHQTPGQIIENGLVHYDCRPNIQRIISEFGHLFDEIIVSTEDHHLKPGDGWVGAKIVSGPDPGSIKQTNHYKDNNKARQFVSTLKGVLELEKNGIEYAMKIRTDIYLDLGKALESFFNLGAENPRAIGATVVQRETFMLHDLYFVARTKELKEFCEAILGFDRFEFIPSVHRDMILKHAYAEYKSEIGVSDWAYFPVSPPAGMNGVTRKIFEYMFEHVYFSLAPDIFKHTLWRGTYFESAHVTQLLKLSNPKKIKYNLPALITIDWDRYFNFRMQVSGKPISIGDKLIIKIGKMGWALWDWMNKVRREIKVK